MDKTYQIGDLVYTITGSQYGSTLNYSIFNSNQNRGVAISELNSYQRYQLSLCCDNFNTGNIIELIENDIKVLS